MALFPRILIISSAVVLTAGTAVAANAETLAAAPQQVEVSVDIGPEWGCRAGLDFGFYKFKANDLKNRCNFWNGDARVSHEMVDIDTFGRDLKVTLGQTAKVTFEKCEISFIGHRQKGFTPRLAVAKIPAGTCSNHNGKAEWNFVPPQS